MYEELVSEYLHMELPELLPRRGGISELPAPRQHNLIHAVIGVRRCGKTFHLYQLMVRLMDAGVPRRQLLYFPFDDDRLGILDELTASRVLDAYYAQVPEADDGCYLFFDEIQEMPGWEGFVRRVAERNKATVVISGSSSKLLSTDIPTKLRGRSLPTEMWPFDFLEYCSFHGVEVPRPGMTCTTRQAGRLSLAFASFLDVGGFPAVQGLDPTTRARVLQGYADEIMTKDVLERFGNASLRAGKRFALSALRSTALKFPVSRQVKAMRGAGISLSNDAAYALLDDFEDAHLAFKVADYSLSIRDNPRSAYKLYSVDQGLSLAVAPANHVDVGQRLETAVFLELKRRYGMDRDRVIASYSSASCPEVDFVVGDALLSAEYELLQVAVSSGRRRAGGEEASKKWRSEVGNLQAAMAETGLRTSTLVTMDEEGEVKRDGLTVRIVPAWKWMTTPRAIRTI